MRSFILALSAVCLPVAGAPEPEPNPYITDSLLYLSPSHKDLRAVLGSRREEFLSMVEEVLLPKIAQDLDEIVLRGWADEVSPKDLCHAHLVVPNAYPLDPAKRYPRIFDGTHILLLYHSHEYDGHWDSPFRNILSSLGEAPRTIAARSKGTKKDDEGVERQILTVDNGDLESWYAGEIEFGRTPEERSAYLQEFRRTARLGKYHFGINTNF
jgi:hypothetical protein